MMRVDSSDLHCRSSSFIHRIARRNPSPGVSEKTVTSPPGSENGATPRTQNRGTNPVSSTEPKTSFLCCCFSVSCHENLYLGCVIWTCAVREMLQLLARVPCKRKVRSEVDSEGRNNRNNEQQISVANACAVSLKPHAAHHLITLIIYTCIGDVQNVSLPFHSIYE